jgi:glutathione S-transferase
MSASHNTRKVLAVIHHLGLLVDLVPVDLVAKETFRPEFLARNPNGLSPVLEDGDLTLWESNAIIVHLASNAANPALWPGGHARSDMFRWLFWQSAHFDPGFDVVAVEYMVKALEQSGPPDLAEVARGERLIARFAPILDAHLADRPFVAGSAPGLADFALGSSLQYQHLVSYPIADFRHLRRWYDHLFTVPAWAETEPQWDALGLPPSPHL